MKLHKNFGKLKSKATIPKIMLPHAPVTVTQYCYCQDCGNYWQEIIRKIKAK